MADAAAKLANGWADPTWWQSPDKRIGFSMALFQSIKAPDGSLATARGGTLFVDAVNLAALKALLKCGIDAVEVQEKKLVNPNGKPL
jgi:hypothetical protein